LVVLTDRRLARLPLPEVISAAVAGGARWVVLRERDLPRPDRLALARELRAVTGRLIVAGPDPLDGDAVHLSGADPRPLGGLLVGRSCHNEAEVDRLSIEDYLTLSPVFDTITKPGYGPALGPSRAAELGRGRQWLALGGVDSPERVEACLAAGASGVAVMGAVMRAADPGRVVRELAAAVPV
jgi:thiamine-phosphate pyrophosphorylase